MTAPSSEPVRISGPLFDGRAAAAATDLCDQIRYTLAWQAHAEARQVMDASFLQPTPYYEIQVTVQPRGDEMVVHDRGIAYGPWLEGGARRRPSQFRGYHMFQRATEAVRPQVQRMVSAIVQPFLRRMNG